MAVKRYNWLTSARQKLGQISVTQWMALFANQYSLNSCQIRPGLKSQSPSDYFQGRHTCIHVGWIHKKHHLQEQRHSHESWRSRVNARSFSISSTFGIGQYVMCASSHDGSCSALWEEGPKMSHEMQLDAMLRCSQVILQSLHITMRSVAAQITVSNKTCVLNWCSMLQPGSLVLRKVATYDSEIDLH